MKNLNPPKMLPNQIYSDLMENAKSEIKKTRLEQLQPYVFERYNLYLASKLRLESMSESAIIEEEDKTILESCYNRNKDGYLEGAVVAKIIELQSIQHQNVCPYCGIDRPRTIDHYLPKNEFPEFSVYPLNLIPCCQFCNGKKGKRWLKEGERLFINYYHDSLPDVKYLYTNIEMSRLGVPKVTFRLENNNNIPSALFNIIQNHYETLDLLREFSLNVASEISAINDKIKHEKISIKSHKRSLQVDLNSLNRLFGRNFWKSSLLEALINCDAFFDSYTKKTEVKV
ncbi:HNH endonuclease [Paenibacillus odorifer]|uniref:HNH endonuclease n=1 Tax=Paenibacillus odorifer TaxID=189426 RepID=UPI0020BFD928|nr:HNH endonuclease signature motif containing protein [Paenibacillus odorifer]